MKKKAFLYEGEYYLLPEGCPSVGALEKKYRGNGKFEVTALVEKKCLAPYFVQENTRVKNLTLNKDAEKYPVFPAEVEIMPLSEYNMRLREIIPEHCKNCPNFGSIDETDESLEGHHEEITLDNICLLEKSASDENGDYDTNFASWFKRAVDQFGSLGLEQLIDEGKCDEAAKLFRDDLLARALYGLPMVWTDRAEDGRYRLIYCSFFDSDTAIVAEPLFEKLAKKYRKTWDIKGGIPKGYMRHNAVRPIGITLDIDENVRNYIILTVYADPNLPEDHEECPSPEYYAWLWMSGTYGEKRMLNVSSSVTVKVVDASEALPENILPPDAPEFALLMRKIEREHKTPKANQMYPTVHIFGDFKEQFTHEPTEEEFFSAITLDASRSATLSRGFAVLVSYGEKPVHPWEAVSALGTAPIGRLVFEAEDHDFVRLNPNGKRTLAALRTYFRVLSKKDYINAVDQRFSKNKFEAYFIISEYDRFLYETLKQAPIFRSYPCELYVYTRSGEGGGRFLPGENMRLIESEPEMLEKLVGPSGDNIS